MKTPPQSSERNPIRRPVAGQCAHLEKLVDELIKETPREEFIRTCMKAAGLTYVADPVQRMTRVLEAIETAKVNARNRKPENGRDL
jgi:hypothetical protein